MTDLELIRKLEQHAGFVIHRLTCDGNIYAQQVNLPDAYIAALELVNAFTLLRKAMHSIERSQKYEQAVQSNMHSFDIGDWDD